MFILTLALAAHAGVSAEIASFPALDAPEGQPPVAEAMGLPADFDADRFDFEVADYQVRLARVLATDGWKYVVPGERIVHLDPEVRGWTGASVPATAIGDLLTGLPAFVPAPRVGWHEEVDDAPGAFEVSHAKVIYGKNGLPKLAARGVSADLGGECGGGFVQYSDLLVVYDDEGQPDTLFVTANTWDGVGVAHHVLIADAVYDDAALVGFDLRTRDESLPCEWCDHDVWEEVGGRSLSYEVSRVRF